MKELSKISIDAYLTKIFGKLYYNNMIRYYSINKVLYIGDSNNFHIMLPLNCFFPSIYNRNTTLYSIEEFQEIYDDDPELFQLSTIYDVSVIKESMKCIKNLPDFIKELEEVNEKSII